MNGYIASKASNLENQNHVMIGFVVVRHVHELASRYHQTHLNMKRNELPVMRSKFQQRK